MTRGRTRGHSDTSRNSTRSRSRSRSSVRVPAPAAPIVTYPHVHPTPVPNMMPPNVYTPSQISWSRDRYDDRRRSRTRSRTPPRSPVIIAPNEMQVEVDNASIKLDSTQDSRITNVSVYASRAEVTRLFTVKVNAGLNQILIRGLPRVLEEGSLRVEGRGAATIHDVALGVSQPPKSIRVPSMNLEELRTSKKRAEMELKRAQRVVSAYETHLSSKAVDAQHTDTKTLAEVVATYEKATRDLDNKILELESQIEKLDKQIELEEANANVPIFTERYDDKLCKRALISILAEVDGEIEIVLKYAVSNASWKPSYDIRVDMQKKEQPIQLGYKGVIYQSTGEDWKEVPLTLETANPTYRLSVPTLDRWTLAIQRPDTHPTYPRRFSPARYRRSPSPSLERSRRRSPQSRIMHATADVSSKGTVNASFSVPGLMSVPSDGQTHNVTIANLFLGSTMSWLCVPKKDTKIHLNAKIKNSSEYTLLGGSANVYLDGSFISKTQIPLVSPEETFECPLGLDPSIRVTYHPRSKNISTSGFYNKSTNHIYEQHITIFNTKNHTIDGLKVLDQFPISENSEISVKYIHPALVIPIHEGTGIGASGKSTAISRVNVSEGVFAQWDGVDEVESGDVPIDAVGKDGKVAWICSIPASSKLGLVLRWEVTAPVKAQVIGL